VGLRAAQTADGAAVRVEFVEPSEADAWAAIDGLMGADRDLGLAIVPSLEIHLPERYDGRYVLVGYAELSKWTALVQKMILEDRVSHLDDKLLAEHVCRAVGARSQAGLVLSSKKSPGPIELARCLVWSVALASKPRTPKRRPAMGFAQGV
jgi:hypothetical protein